MNFISLIISCNANLNSNYRCLTFRINNMTTAFFIFIKSLCRESFMMVVLVNHLIVLVSYSAINKFSIEYKIIL